MPMIPFTRSASPTSDVSSLDAARWNKEEAMERRKFLGALTGASLSVPLEGSSAERAGAQHPTASSARVARQSSFAPSQVEVAGNTIFVRRYGTGPAILLVHGFPRTSLMWRFLAPRLAENHTVICVDLRAYGRSGIPASTDNHFPYSKRAMAEELVAVMVTLGFPTFTLIGHDRGGRVCYRMALDHPKHVERLAVLDVIPILEGWSRADARFAQTYWPRSSRSRRAICSGLPRPFSRILSGTVPLVQRFSKNTCPPIVIRPAFMASVRNIEPQPRSMSNTIVLTRKHPGESNARCCISGPRVAGSTHSI